MALLTVFLAETANPLQLASAVQALGLILLGLVAATWFPKLFSFLRAKTRETAQEIAKAVDQHGVPQAPLAGEVTKVALSVLPEAKADRCFSCAHFDQDLGQRTVATNGAFTQAAEHIGPAAMAHGYKFDEDGNRTGVNVDDPQKLRWKWSDLGACLEHQELRLGTDVCEKWKAKG